MSESFTSPAEQFAVGSYFGCFNTCPDSTYESGNYCISCNESCLTCSGPRDDQCTSCQDGSFLHFNRCIPTCPSNTYSNTISNECQNCSSNCQTCLGTSSSQCLSCALNFPYFSSKETDSGFMLTCKENCDENEYLTENSTECLSCHSSCKTCSGKEENECTSCPDGSNLNDGKCVASSSKKNVYNYNSFDYSRCWSIHDYCFSYNPFGEDPKEKKENICFKR